MAPRTPLQQALDVAARQAGAVATEQAFAAGLSEHQVRHLRATGQWRRAARGVSVVAGSPDTWRQRVWVAYLATQPLGVVSHVSAAALFGVLPASPLPHVTVPPRSSARSPSAKIHRSALVAEDCQWRDGLRVVTPSRLLVDLAGVLAGDAFASLVDDVLVQRLASHESVVRAAGRVGRGRAGVEVLRRTLDVWTPAIEPGSVAEVRLLRLLADLGIGDVVTQHEVRTPDGAFVARLDVAQPANQRGFEYDGARHHGPRAWSRDEPRYARLRALGWDIVPVTKADLLPGETRLHGIADRWLRSLATG